MNIQILLKDAARQFLIALPPEIRKKFTLAFRKTEAGFKGDWFEKLQGEDNLFEFRVSGNNTWYRLLAFWSEKEKSLIIATHGFEKKQNKTPKKEIDKATAIKRVYNKGDS
jgi:phage-related protein